MANAQDKEGPREGPGAKGIDVGAFIREQRERSRISLRKLADHAGISNPYLSQIERGLRKPSAEILKGIAKSLSISAETLYTKAGLLEERANPSTLAEAVENDAHLDARQKQVILDLYRTFVRETDNETEKR
jgi:transcriptional regulator with XRE-family HTH domain